MAAQKGCSLLAPQAESVGEASALTGTSEFRSVSYLNTPPRKVGHSQDASGSSSAGLCCGISLASTKEVIDSNTGLLLVVASEGFFAFMNLSVKFLNRIDPPVPTLELMLVRMFITYAFSIVYMLATGVQNPFLGPKGVRLLLVFRGFSGFFGIFGLFFSLRYLSLSDATVLTFLAPLATAMAGAFFLGEKFTRREALAGVVSLMGVTLIARPVGIFGDLPGDSNSDTPPGHPGSVTPAERLLAVGVALTGVLGSTGAYTSITAIGKRAHPLHSLAFVSSQCVIASSIGMAVTRTPFVVPTRIEWLSLLGLIGVLGFVAQLLMAMGLQRETAGRGTMAVYTQIIFATVLQRIFFKTIPSFLSIIGTIMILTSAFWVAIMRPKPTATLTHIEDGLLRESLLGRTSEDDEAERPNFVRQGHSG